MLTNLCKMIINLKFMITKLITQALSQSLHKEVLQQVNPSTALITLLQTNLTHQRTITDVYKTVERLIEPFMRNNVKCCNSRDKLNITIYYKTSSISSLLTKNDQSPRPNDLQKSNLIYEFTCPIGDWERLRNSYVGLTTTSLSRRLTMHKSDGAPKIYVNTMDNLPIYRKTLV